jgi:hypothetical protein
MIIRRLLFLIILVVAFWSNATAEIIENRKIINRSYDVWRVSCEDDEMLSEISCRLFVEITQGTTFFVNPLSNENPILLVSEDAYYDRNVFVKIDNNKIITSQAAINNKYNIINFNLNDAKALYNQIKAGKEFFIRFTIKDTSSLNGYKEITAKFSLAEFQKALIYYNNQVNKYNFTINNVN